MGKRASDMGKKKMGKPARDALTLLERGSYK